MSTPALVQANQDFWHGHRLIRKGETFRADHEIPKAKPVFFRPYREPEAAVAGPTRRR